jgi:Ca2+-binding EF-hand superfamily protein
MKNFIAKFMLTALLASTAIIAQAEPATPQTQTRTYSYDSNKDGYIQPEEFTNYVYTKSDTNGDGYMGDEEWKLSTSQLYRPYKDINYNNYTYWDQDKDNRLDNNEVKTLVEKTGLYSKWDKNKDSKVSNAEFEVGTFNSYDDNNDGVLSLDEWKSVLR